MEIGSQKHLPSYEEALADPAKARVLFDASKGGNVRGITEDHRYELANVMQRVRDLASLRQAIIDHSHGNMFWIGEILLDVLECETGYRGEVRQ